MLLSGQRFLGLIYLTTGLRDRYSESIEKSQPIHMSTAVYSSAAGCRLERVTSGMPRFRN